MDDTAVAAQRAQQLEFIEKTLIARIVKRMGTGTELVSAKASLQSQLDGYMSAIYNLSLTTRNNGDAPVDHPIIVKLMKGDLNFRTGSKSFQQFANEVYIYAKVLPCYTELLANSASTLRIDDLVARSYYGFFGAVNELGALDESILALRDLRPLGYRLGPHLLLPENHLRMTVELLGQYHSLSYALKLRHPEVYAELVAGLIVLPFVPDADAKQNIYTVMYGIAFDRFDAYMQRTRTKRTEKMQRDVANMYRLYGDRPVELLERLRRSDDPFTCITHGDYNRNNVLYQYAEKEGHDAPLAVRMIDFQEVRYVSPAFDLAFLLYMNTDLPGTSARIWDQLLSHYHDTMIRSLATITGLSQQDAALQPYSYERFLAHFSQFAVYGALVCMHFTPWKVGPDAECDRLATLFERDMFGAEFRDFSMIAGGDIADERIAGIVEHASSCGYMRIFEETEGGRAQEKHS